MTQQIESIIWREFEVEQKKAESELKIKVSNSGKPTTEWTRKVCEKVRISELAREHGITCCPFCGYGIDFDDSRGWFICHRAKYDNACEFKGNIVDFCERTGCLE